MRRGTGNEIQKSIEKNQKEMIRTLIYLIFGKPRL